MACLWAALVARLEADSDGTHPTLLCQGMFRRYSGRGCQTNHVCMHLAHQIDSGRPWQHGDF